MNDGKGELYGSWGKPETSGQNPLSTQLSPDNPYVDEPPKKNKTSEILSNVDFYAGIPIPEDKKRENDESVKLTGEMKWTYNPYYNDGDGWELNSTCLSRSSSNEVIQPLQTVVEKSKVTLGDISAVEQPVYKDLSVDGEDEREYSLYNFLEKQKEYMATIQLIVMEILGNNWSGEITLSKRDLVMDTSNTKMSNPDDRIEFILEKGHKGAVVLLVRNKDVFPGEIKKTLRGQITDLTTNEVWNFCEENDGSDALNVVHMREVLPRNGESEKGKKFFGLVDKNGKKDDILGIACVLEGSDKSAHLHRLAVSPSSQGSGVGGRIIESLKEKYDVITLRPTPEGRVLGETENPAENLRRYYKKRGFISGGDYTWNKNWINLNDETTAREWREIDDKNSIVFDDVKRSGAEVVDLFLRRIWVDKKDELNSETKDALSWWLEVRKEIKMSEANLRRLRDERLKQAGLI